MRSKTRGTRICAAIWAIWGGAAMAADAGGLEAVVVTGSHLRGGAGDSALPVQVITRRDIERSGAATTAELLSRVAANQPFQGEAVAVGGYGPAAYAGANLRGLGDNNTLVLVNGRRIAQHASVTYGTGADLLSIPLAAVERVEILKDGASAVYGADAVGGVVNFILRSDYSGVALQLDVSGTKGGGGSGQGLSLTAGGALAEGSAHWTGTVGWRKERALAARERAFSRSNYVAGLVNQLSYGSWPATVSESNGDYSPAYPDCGPPHSVPDPDGSGYCLYDAASTVDLLPASERLNGTLRLDGRAWDATARWYVEGMASRNVQRTTASAGWVAGFDVASGSWSYPVLPSTSAYYPTAWAAANGVTEDLSLYYWRLADQGGRRDRHVGDQQRVLMGLQGETAGWQWDGAATLTRHRLVSSMRGGYWRYSDLAGMVADGSLNPLGNQSAATQARLDSLAVRDPYAWMETRTRGLDFKASRPVARLPGGAVALSVGGEVRRETLSSVYSDDALNCVVSGGLCGGFNLERGRNAEALFAEMTLPVSDEFSAQLALRHDRYGTGGSATTPKAALRWRVAPGMMWRASAGRGFIAPSLEQLYAPAVYAYAPGSEVADAALCDTTDPADGYDCGRQGHNLRTSGNDRLKPETSRQLSLGFVLGETTRWRTSVDAWAVNKRNKIGYVPVGTVFSNPTLYESMGYIVRYQPGDPLPAGSSCATGPNGLVCPIHYIDGQYRNLGQQKAAGLDLGVQSRMPSALGWWSLTFDGTWVLRHKTQVSAVSPYVDQLGRYALDRPVPRWRHFAQASLEQGAWQWTVGHRFVGSYVDFNPDPTQVADRRVRPQSLFDAQAAYRWSEAVSLSLSVRNVFDVAPPASRQVNSFQVGYDPHFADPRGRIVSLRTQWRL